MKKRSGSFAVRMEYFFREPIDEKMFEEGMDVWLERRKALWEQGVYSIERTEK